MQERAVLVSMGDIGDSIMKWIPAADFYFEEGYDYFPVPCKGSMDITRARRDLDYKPVYHLHEAVKDYLQYLKVMSPIVEIPRQSL
jgi:UDP-glucose 4-epimerase